MVLESPSLEGLSAEQLRAVLHDVLQATVAKDKALSYKQAIIDKLTHEIALLKRMKFAALSEAHARRKLFDLHAANRSQIA